MADIVSSTTQQDDNHSNAHANGHPGPNGTTTPNLTADRFRVRAEVTGADEDRHHPLELKPIKVGNPPPSRIPNTPLSVATISFLLGTVFAFGLTVCFLGESWGLWWSRYQLGIYIAAWAVFHWGEFAVTAGWNLEKCSVDCTSTISYSTHSISCNA